MLRSWPVLAACPDHVQRQLNGGRSLFQIPNATLAPTVAAQSDELALNPTEGPGLIHTAGAYSTTTSTPAPSRDPTAEARASGSKIGYTGEAEDKRRGVRLFWGVGGLVLIAAGALFAYTQFVQLREQSAAGEPRAGSAPESTPEVASESPEQEKAPLPERNEPPERKEIEVHYEVRPAEATVTIDGETVAA